MAVSVTALIGLQLADCVTTHLALLTGRFGELNPAARAVWAVDGELGLMLVKMTLVALVAGIAWRCRLRTPLGVLVGVSLMAVVGNLSLLTAH